MGWLSSGSLALPNLEHPLPGPESWLAGNRASQQFRLKLMPGSQTENDYAESKGIKTPNINRETTNRVLAYDHRSDGGRNG